MDRMTHEVGTKVSCQPEAFEPHPSSKHLACGKPAASQDSGQCFALKGEGDIWKLGFLEGLARVRSVHTGRRE